MLYLIQSPIKTPSGIYIDIYKVGYTSDIIRRQKAYNTHNPGHKLLGTLPGSINDESDIHSRDYCYQYTYQDWPEWFIYSPTMIEQFNPPLGDIDFDPNLGLDYLRWFFITSFPKTLPDYEYHVPVDKSIYIKNYLFGLFYNLIWKYIKSYDYSRFYKLLPSGIYEYSGIPESFYQIMKDKLGEDMNNFMKISDFGIYPYYHYFPPLSGYDLKDDLQDIGEKADLFKDILGEYQESYISELINLYLGELVYNYKKTINKRK